MRQFLAVILLFGLATLLVACGDSPEPARMQSASKSVEQKPVPMAVLQPEQQRVRDMSLIMQGGKVFQQNCAVCHGAQAQGAPDWQRPDASGKYPPPPLNGTAHSWHHPMKVLKRVIKQGTAAQGGNMPAWEGKLSDKEIDAVIAWFQNKWPDPLYAAWARRNATQ